MKKTHLALAVLMTAGSVYAQNIPAGMTGLWRFQTAADKLKATIGADLVTSNPSNPNWLTGPYTQIAAPLGSDGGVIQDMSWDYLSVYHGIGAEGKGTGDYINKYSILVDFYAGGNAWNSLYQTAWNGNANDGDLWVNAATTTAATIGVGDIGYSATTFDATKWHRIVWSVDNGNFFRVYVDGALLLDGAGQAVDGRWALELDRFNLFADDSWEDAWCMAGTVAVWNRPLTGDEVAGMGGWIGNAAEPTPLVPEPTSMSLLAIGGLYALARRNRK